MKKFYITLLIFTITQLSTFAYENYRGEDILKKIDDAVIKANPKKMEKLWIEFCKVNPTYCEVMQPKFNEVLYNVKIERQARNRQIWTGIAAGLAGASYSSSQNIVPKQSYVTVNQNGQMVGPGIYNPPAYNIYNSYGQNVGRITPY